MSRDQIVDIVNSSNADIQAVSLGAQKGQLWLHRNRGRLTIPIRAHLGAALNFQAGTVKRAPPTLRRWGLEWLWRIKEEPHLWIRYWDDGIALLRLLLTRVLPLAIATRWYRIRWQHRGQDLLIKTSQDHHSIVISLCGVATETHIGKAISCFREAITGRRNVIIHLSDTRFIDARFFGLV